MPADNITYLEFDPVDVLFFRGNRLFGDPGEHADSLVPPWPSVLSGAVASRILADADALGRACASPDNAEDVLAEFAGTDFGLEAQGITKNGNPYFPVPADIVVFEKDGYIRLRRIIPRRIASGGVSSSFALPLLPVLEGGEREKPKTGYWIDSAGLAAHLAGKVPDKSSFVNSSELWKTDQRLGIALDSSSRTAGDGKIYTSDAVAFNSGVSLFAAFRGSGIPDSGLVRLGGDGRGAVISVSETLDGRLKGIGKPGAGWPGFRMITATPGVFSGGWLPPGLEDDGRTWGIDGLSAELMCASVSRHGVISGWDMARHTPKDARKVAPAGSVYWFRVTGGDTAALEEIRELGLYALPGFDDRARRREGYGRVWFGRWNPEDLNKEG